MARAANTTEIRQLASQVVDDLASGLSVLLTGLPGSGRSHIARLVAQDLGRLHINAVMMRGNSLLVDRPLAALNLSDPKGQEARATAGASPMSYAADRLEALVDQSKSVIIIDDADEVDSTTAGLIANMRGRRKVPLLVIAISDADPGDVVDKLVSAAQPGVAVKLNGMSFEGVTRMVNRMLDGPISADALSMIATLSGGLPGLIESIVQLGSRDGRLVRQKGTWVAPGGDLWDPGLRFSLLPLLRGLDRDDIDFLVQVADGRVTEATRGEPVRRLTQRGILCHDQMSPGGYVFPPVLAEWLRRDGYQSQTATDRSSLAAIDMGRWPTNLTGAEAAALTDRIRTHWYSEVTRLWRDWNGDRGPRTAIPLLMALFSGGANDDRIDVVFDKTNQVLADHGDDPAAVVEYRSLGAIYRAMWRSDLAGGLSDLSQLRQTYPDMAGYAAGWALRLTLACRGVPEEADMALVDSQGLTSDILTAARIEILVAQGRVRDAAEQLAQFDPTHEPSQLVREILEELILVLGDQPAAGVELAIKRLWGCLMRLDVTAISGHAYAAGLGMCLLGRFDELSSIVEIMYRLGDSNVFQNRYKTGLFMLGSFVSGWQGRGDYAHNLARQAESLRVTRGPFPGMTANYYDDWPTDRLWDLVDDLLERGYLASAVFLAVPAAEVDSGSGRAKVLIKRAAGAQSPVLRALGHYVANLVSGDLGQYGATVEELRGTCGPLDVTRATVSWALGLRERGDLAGWLARTVDAWNESTGISGPCDGLFARLVEAVGLTEREAEVAHLASDGLSSQEIADKMGVATRTIEAHLHSVYRKAGVNSRDQLRQLADTWLTLPVAD